MTLAGSVSQVRIGASARLPGAGRRGAGIDTAYRKSLVTGPVAVTALGLEGDVQVNRRYHGGAEKAVYGYPQSGYAGWQAEFPDIADRFVPGAMGENLVITGQDEASLCIGDVIRCGTATLQISQLREPCSTFAAIIGTTRVVRAMVRSGRCGWYYRVLEPGAIAAGDSHDVIERANPDWPVARFAAVAAGREGTLAALQALTTLKGLTPDWQQRAAAMAAKQGV